MLQISDFSVSTDDDIVISKSGVELEYDPYVNTMLVAQRRICARLDDFPNYRTSAAGLEQYLFQLGVMKYSQEIKTSISRCLARDGVLNEANLKIDVLDTKTNTAKILIHFIFPYSATNRAFRVLVDAQNQRIYKGF